MAGDRDVRLTLRVTAEGLEVVDQAGRKLGGVREEAERTGLQGGASLTGLATKLGGLAAASALAYGAIRQIRSAIDEMENLNRLAQMTGLATEQLSKLGYSASLAETDLGSLSVGLRFFARNLVEARQGGAEAQAAFARLRIDIGQGIEPALMAAADAFTRLADGEAKTAAAVSIFGRAGASLIPLLNQGAAALRAQGIEAERLGVVVSGSAARAADEFNDNLTRLTTAGKGLGIGLANTLLPALTAVAERLLYATEKARETNLALGALALFVQEHDFTPPAEIMAERERQAAQQAEQFGNRGAVSLRELRERRQVIEGGLGTNIGPEIPRAEFVLRQSEQRAAALQGEMQQLTAHIALKEKLLAQEKGTSDQLAVQQVLATDITSLNAALLAKKEETLRTQASLALMQGKTAEYESLQAQLASVVFERKQQGIEASMRGLELSRHAYEVARQQATLASEAEMIAAESTVTVAERRLAAAEQEGASRATLLDLAQELDTAEQARLRAQIEGLERMRAVMLTMPATPLKESEIAVVTARIETMNDQLATTPSHVAKMQTAFLDVGKTVTDTLTDVVKGIALGTGTLEDAGRRMGEALTGKLIEAVIKDKIELDLKLEQNFLRELPQMIGLGGTKIGDVFRSVFGDITTDATRTADTVGATFRNVPGVGNIADATRWVGDMGTQRATAGLAYTPAAGPMTAAVPQGEAPASIATGAGAAAGAAIPIIGAALVLAGEGAKAIQERSEFGRAEQRRSIAPGGIVTAGLARLLGLRGTSARVLHAMASLGMSELFDTLGVAELLGIGNAPMAEGLIGDALGDLIEKLGVPKPRGAGGARKGPSQRPFDFGRLGDYGYPQVPLPTEYAALNTTGLALGGLKSYAELIQPGVGRGGSQTMLMSGVVQGVLNLSAALKLSGEDAQALVTTLSKPLLGNTLSEAVLQLESMRVDGKISMDELTSGISGAITAFGDLAPSIDAASLALSALDTDGTLHLERLIRAVDVAKRAASDLNLGAAFQAGLTGGSFRQSLALNMRSAFTDAITTALADSPETQAAFKGFTTATATASEFFRSGDFESGASVLQQAGRSWWEAMVATQRTWLHLMRDAPELKRMFDEIQSLQEGPGLIEQARSQAESLRGRAEEARVGTFSPGRQLAYWQGKLSSIDAELAALRASPGGIDTNEELKRARELAGERETVGERLLGMASGRGQTLRAANILEDTAALFDEIGTAQQAQIDAIVTSTTATEHNTQAIEANTAALLAGGARAGGITVNTDIHAESITDLQAAGSQIASLVLQALEDPRVRAKVKQTAATG